MAMRQLTLPGKIVKKHNDLVRSKINISNKTASRILACLVAVIRHGDTQFKTSYTVSIKDFLPQDEGNIYRQAKEACRELLTATAEKEWLDSNGEPIFEGMTFFTSIKYTKGTVRATFNSRMSEVLLQLHDYFTEYNLIEYLLLPSTYSQRLFEILQSWKNIERGYADISVADLHSLLNTPESFRANFKDFRRWVLEKAHKDIHEKTKLKFEWEPMKFGRSVTQIRFTFGHRRKVIDEAEPNKVKEAKKRRLQSQRITRALECARMKKGECVERDNKPIICKFCKTKDWDFCAELQRRNENNLE
jgi:plasmid replication initiation protein